MPAFRTSSQYWNDRYREGGNSGTGSAGRLAVFKAETLNNFMRRHGVNTVIEFGCGDGVQLALAEYPSYVGIDASPKAVEICREKFKPDSSKRFFNASDVSMSTLDKAELSLSLDVIFHLVEDDVFNAYMKALFEWALRYVIIYSSNEDKSWTDPHVKHRAFTRWVHQNGPNWTLLEKVSNRYPYDPADPDNTSFCDFYIYERP